jgi:hypothetical protein
MIVLMCDAWFMCAILILGYVSVLIYSHDIINVLCSVRICYHGDILLCSVPVYCHYLIIMLFSIHIWCRDVALCSAHMCCLPPNIMVSSVSVVFHDMICSVHVYYRVINIMICSRVLQMYHILPIQVHISCSKCYHYAQLIDAIMTQL